MLSESLVKVKKTIKATQAGYGLHAHGRGCLDTALNSVG